METITMENKVMLLWVEKGCRKPKMQGTATSTGSVYAISDFRRMAQQGKGTFYIVQGKNVNIARKLITDLKNDPEQITKVFPVKYCDNDHTICIGERSIQAITGSEVNLRLHDQFSQYDLRLL